MAIAKRKKKFFDVEIPSINRTTQLQAFEVAELNGKFLKYDLTRILRGKNIDLQLKVEVKDEKAVATPRTLKLMPYYLRRMVRKGTNYVEDSFSTDCKDAVVRIKPFLITRRKVSRAVRKALREKARSELIIYLKGKTTKAVFEDLMRNSLQKDLSLKLKKIYPLSLCEIRIFKVESVKDIVEEKAEKKEVPKEGTRTSDEEVKEEVKKEEKVEEKKVEVKKEPKKEEKVVEIKVEEKEEVKEEEKKE
jgi:ribosomal protein S3AE